MSSWECNGRVVGALRVRTGPAAAGEPEQQQKEAEAPSVSEEQPAAAAVAADDDADGDDETCGFCKFMKGGACRAAFTVSAEARVAAAACRCCCCYCYAGRDALVCARQRAPRPPPTSPQQWSNCVDRERDAGSDFTEECRDAVSAAAGDLLVLRRQRLQGAQLCVVQHAALMCSQLPGCRSGA